MSHLEYNPNASYQPQTNYQPMYPSQPQPQPQYYQQQQPQHPYQHSQHQQQIGIIIRERTDEWDGGLFDCCSDVETCVKAMICMPIFLAIEKAEWDGTHCCLNFCCTTMLPLRHQTHTHTMELLELPHKVAKLKILDQEIFALQTLVSFELSKEATPPDAKCFVQSGQVFLRVKTDQVRNDKQEQLNQLNKERTLLRKQVEDLQKLLEREKRTAASTTSQKANR